MIKDDSVLDYEDLPDPAESAAEAAEKLAEAVDLLQSVVQELKNLQSYELCGILDIEKDNRPQRWVAKEKKF